MVTCSIDNEAPQDSTIVPIGNDNKVKMQEKIQKD